jgi:hypothetical protein
MNTISYLRSFKIGPFAIFDFLASYILIYIISPILINLFSKINIKITKAQLFWSVIPLSIIFHIIFKQQTPLTKLFLDPKGGYFVKLIVLFMTYKAIYSKP